MFFCCWFGFPFLYCRIEFFYAFEVIECHIRSFFWVQSYSCTGELFHCFVNSVEIKCGNLTCIPFLISFGQWGFGFGVGKIKCPSMIFANGWLCSVVFWLKTQGFHLRFLVETLLLLLWWWCLSMPIWLLLGFRIEQWVLCLMPPFWPTFPLLHWVQVLLGRFLGLLGVWMLYRQSWWGISLVQQSVLHSHELLPPSVVGIVAAIAMRSFLSNVVLWSVCWPWILVAISFRSLPLVSAMIPIFIVGFAPTFG